MSELVHIDGAPRPPTSPREIVRIAINLTIVCALGALVLGGIYMGTERYQEAARLASERHAVTELLALPADATVLEVSQSLDPGRRLVVYRAKPYGAADAAARVLVFGLDGTRQPGAPAAGATQSLGRFFVGREHGVDAGFVIEGETRGYKNRIRFFVALDSTYHIAGVRVLEHEEDPGLGAEVATSWFTGQFLGRSSEQVSSMDVTRDPMPEDWRGALATLAHEGAAAWRAAHSALVTREDAKAVYAVTGATISSRALTRGVRGTVEHFRRRWALLAPQLGGGQ